MIHKILYKEVNLNDYKLYVPSQEDIEKTSLNDLIIKNIPANSTYWFVRFDEIPNDIETVVKELKEYTN
jgi:hypothetical protein